MSKSFLMGNEAIGLGAVRAGVKVVSGYPGTPSTEVLETPFQAPEIHRLPLSLNWVRW